MKLFTVAVSENSKYYAMINSYTWMLINIDISKARKISLHSIVLKYPYINKLLGWL